MKTSNIKLAEPRKGRVGVSGGNRAGHNKNEIDDGEIEDNEIGKKVQNLLKSKKLSKSKEMLRSDFFIPRTKLAFTELRQAFLKALIFHHFDLERHIRIETNISGYVIDRVINQLTSNDLGWWHPMTFFSYKMIPMETRYEMHNSEFLAIIETFKT